MPVVLSRLSSLFKNHISRELANRKIFLYKLSVRYLVVKPVWVGLRFVSIRSFVVLCREKTCNSIFLQAFMVGRIVSSLHLIGICQSVALNHKDNARLFSVGVQGTL